MEATHYNVTAWTHIMSQHQDVQRPEMKATHCHAVTWPYLLVTTPSQEKIKGEEHLPPCRDMRDLHVATSCIWRRILEEAILSYRDIRDLYLVTSEEFLKYTFYHVIT